MQRKPPESLALQQHRNQIASIAPTLRAELVVRADAKLWQPVKRWSVCDNRRASAGQNYANNAVSCATDGGDPLSGFLVNQRLEVPCLRWYKWCCRSWCLPGCLVHRRHGVLVLAQVSVAWLTLLRGYRGYISTCWFAINAGGEQNALSSHHYQTTTLASDQTLSSTCSRVLVQLVEAMRLSDFQKAFGQAYAAGDRDALRQLAAAIRPD